MERKRSIRNWLVIVLVALFMAGNFLYAKSEEKTTFEQKTEKKVSEEEAAIEKLRKKAMAKTVTLEFEQASFRDVIKFLADATGLDLIIDESVFKEKISDTKSAPVTIRLRNMPLLEALDILLATRGLGYEIRPDYIWITSAENTMPIKFFDLTFLKNAPEVGDVSKIPEIIRKFVSQPTGSQLEIISEQNKLLVKNTRENIRKTEKILHQCGKPYLLQVALLYSKKEGVKPEVIYKENVRLWASFQESRQHTWEATDKLGNRYEFSFTLEPIASAGTHQCSFVVEHKITKPSPAEGTIRGGGFQPDYLGIPARLGPINMLVTFNDLKPR